MEELLAEHERESILRSYRETINKYVLQFSDKPLRMPGGASYGTRRDWMKRFIEDFVIANDRLPTGRHRIDAKIGGVGYSGGFHHFSDLK